MSLKLTPKIITYNKAKIFRSERVNETLNRSKHRIVFSSNFMINNLSVEDFQEIANHFNRFFIDVGSDLSNKIVVDNASSKFTDYGTHPTNLNFNFNLTTENEI